MHLGPLPKCTLDEYCRERIGLTIVRRFDATAVDGKSLVVNTHSRFERDTALGARKRRLTVYAGGV